MPSFAKRYTAKLVANIGGLLAGAVVVLVVPRSLGASDYGQAEFLLTFFSGIVGVIELGTSIGFYAWLSRKPDNAGMVRGYLIAAFCVYGVLVALILGAFALGTPAMWLWPGAAFAYVLAGSFAAWLLWMQQLMQKTLDARALTIRGETRILLCRLAGAGLLVVVVLCQMLTLGAYLGYLILLPLITACLLAGALRGEVVSGIRWWSAVGKAKLDWKSLINDFTPYIVPLFIYNIITTGAMLTDRWVLQNFGGAVEQGLFSFGSRIASLCFLFSAAMAQLLTREFAIAWQVGDKPELGRLFSRYVPPLYALSAVIATFLAWHGEEVVIFVGGPEFATGAAALTIFAFYPMHQTLGQLSAAVFYATANMRAYARIGIGGALVGLPLLWMLVAPISLGGLAFGSLGLAIKMVVIQIVFVNVSVFIIARDFGLNFRRLLFFQIAVPATCILFAMVSSWLSHHVLSSGSAGFIISGVFYLALVVAALVTVPILFGIQRGDLRRVLGLARG